MAGQCNNFLEAKTMNNNNRAAKRGKKFPVQLNSRVSHEDIQKIKEDAERAGMSICKFVRMRATSAHISSKVDVKTLQELNAIGRMLKKMWSEGHDTNAALSAVKAAAKSISSIN